MSLRNPALRLDSRFTHMMSRPEAVLLVGACLALATPTHAQIWDEPVFTVYGMEAGLSQGTVNVLYQDEPGFIWIGTQDGLNRFDGLEFVPFKHSQNDSTSLSDDYVLSIAAASNGGMWVGTDRGGLNLFDPRSGSSVRYPLEELGPWEMFSEGADQTRTGRTVTGILPLSDGSLVLATDKGLVRFAPWDGAEAGLLPMPDDHLTGRESQATCGFQGGGGLAGFSDGSIWRIDPSGSVNLAFRVPNPVRMLRCSSAAASFLGTTAGEIYRIDPGTRSGELLLGLDPVVGETVSITDVWEGPRGKLWIATEFGLLLTSGDGTVRRVEPGSHSPGPPVEEIITFLEDRNDILWVGTWNGLAKVHPLSHEIRRIFHGTDNSAGISGNGVVAIEGSGDGGVWVGSLDGGVDRVGPEWREEGFYLSEPDALNPWTRTHVFDLSRDAEGRLWIATVPRSVVVLEPNEEVARTVPLVDSLGVSRTAIGAYSVFVDRAGEVWAGTRDHGLARYESAEGVFRQYRGPEGDWHFGSNWIWPIAEDSQGRLWVGAFSGGVSVIDSTRQTHRLYQARTGGLSDSRVLTLFVDSRDKVWIGTQGGGLNRLDPITDSVRVYTTLDGLPHDHVEGIIEDNQGFLWISTNGGIARFDPSTEAFWVLREGVGLAGNRFFANSVFMSERGELFFGGEEGLTILDPAILRPREDAIPPRVVLTGLRVSGRPVPLARVSPGSGLSLSPEERFFSFEFAALQFSDPTQNRYRYKLEGLDADWVDAGTTRSAHYTAVRPGRYTFMVGATDADGVTNDSGLRIPVLVRAPYFATLWFRSVLATVLFLSASWIVYRRITEHRRRFDIASRLHDGIGANIASILRAAERVAPDLPSDSPGREGMTRVASLARRAQTETKAAVRILRKGKEADTVDSLVGELRDTAEWMLHGNVRYQLSAPEEVPRRAIGWKARTDTCLLFNEALNNVLKHADASFVEVDIAYRPPEVHLRIADNGKGFDPEAGGAGNGLELMREHATRHGGEVTIRSKAGGGTVLEARVKVH